MSPHFTTSALHDIALASRILTCAGVVPDQLRLLLLPSFVDTSAQILDGTLLPPTGVARIANTAALAQCMRMINDQSQLPSNSSVFFMTSGLQNFCNVLQYANDLLPGKYRGDWTSWLMTLPSASALIAGRLDHGLKQLNAGVQTVALTP